MAKKKRARRSPPSPSTADAAPAPALVPKPKPEPEPKREPEPGPVRDPQDIPPRFVAIAYVLAAICYIAPLAILGAGFAGAVLIRRGRTGPGAGVVAVAVVCAVAGVLVRTSAA